MTGATSPAARRKVPAILPALLDEIAHQLVQPAMAASLALEVAIIEVGPQAPEATARLLVAQDHLDASRCMLDGLSHAVTVTEVPEDLGRIHTDVGGVLAEILVGLPIEHLPQVKIHRVVLREAVSTLSVALGTGPGDIKASVNQQRVILELSGDNSLRTVWNMWTALLRMLGATVRQHLRARRRILTVGLAISATPAGDDAPVHCY